MAIPSGKMTRREQKICARIKGFRERLNWSQPAFARKIGITKDQLINIEYGRTPLRYSVFLAISKNCCINPVWLARGEGNDLLNFDFPAPDLTELKVPERALFSDVFLNHLAPIFNSGDADPMAEILLRYQRAKTAQKLIELNFVDVPDGLVHEFEFDLDNFVQGWFSRHEDEGETRKAQRHLWYRRLADNIQARVAAEKEAEKNSQEILDEGTLPADTAAVKTKIRSLPDLVKALRERTKMRGQKAALARKLGVSRQAVDQWLRGSAKPSAETTLALLNWVGEPRAH